MRIPLFGQVLPAYALIGLMLAVPIHQHRVAAQHARAVAQAASIQVDHAPVAQKKYIGGTPQRIVIASVGIDLKVQKGTYYFNANTWSVSNIDANYASNTALINNTQDKTLIYGHWTQHVFGPTKNLKSGDFAYVYTDNGHVFKYRFQSTQIIKPTDVTVFNEFKGKPGLVLMTCQGAWAQERRLMFFTLVRAV